MKNNYEIRGEVTAIFIKRKDGTVLETLIDTHELSKVAEFENTWLAKFDPILKQYYAYGRKHNNGKSNSFFLHRVILEFPKGMMVDHINHNTLDNRRKNLRITTNSENQQNRKGPSRNNKSGYIGVDWSKENRKWRARIRINGKEINLGYFDDVHEAGRIVAEGRSKLMPFSQEALFK